MDYAIRKLAGQSRLWVPITESEYHTVVAHTKHIISALEIEEKFDVLVGNHEEFETELLRLTVAKLTHKRSDWHDGARNRRLLNRRLNNFLSSSRMYLDHLRHGISSIYGPDSDQMATVDDARHKQYDSSLSYRLIEELRNYTQHRRLPIDVETTTFKPTEYGDDKQVSCTLTPQLTKANVLEDGKIKAKFRPELEAQPDRIDLKLHLRNYVQALWAIHRCLREILSPDFDQWEQTVESLIRRWEEKDDSTLIALYVVAQSDDEYPIVSEKRTLFREPIKEFRQLQERNDLHPDLASQYATSQVSERILQEKPNQQVERTR